MTIAAAESLPLTRATFGWLSWAAFLGMSWTWCIGMFLPVILVRDYGILGWIIFAVPNVLGAAAMGWVIRSRESSERIVANHRMAGVMFSAVTIAFHLFFVVAVIAPLAQSVTRPRAEGGTATEAINLAAGGMIVAAVLLYVYMTRRRDADRTLAWVTLLISATVIFCTLPDLLLPSLGMGRMQKLQGSAPIDLLYLAPVCIFGFLCCPYLDLTFHRAHQYSSNPRASFGVGFVGMFLPMIVFTLFYAWAMMGGTLTQWIAAFLYVHLAVQSAFTVAAHARELQRDPIIGGTVVAFLTLGSVWIYFTPDDFPLDNSLRMGELIYRGFMGFYGLVFPAYVWLVMLPSRGQARPTIRQWVVFALAVLLALPMFFGGFLLQKTIWLLPGLALVLGAYLLASRTKARRAEAIAI